MHYVRLVAVYDEFDTAPGLVVVGTKMTEGMYADRDGTLVAHDILEHQNGVKAIGPIDDELQALGGVMQVRGQHGDMCTGRTQYHPVESTLASDVTNMARDLCWSDGWVPRLGQYRTHRHDYDDAFNEVTRIARELIPGELDEDELREFPMDAYLDNALHLMRTGFRKAQRRFGDGYKGIELFKAISRAVKGVTIDYEGQEFRLAYGDGAAWVLPLYEDN